MPETLSRLNTLQKIVAAMKRGSLPPDLSITSGIYGQILLGVPRGGRIENQRDLEITTLQWLRRNFGLEEPTYEGTYQHKRYHRVPLVFDQMRARTTRGDISMPYLLTHQHRDYLGTASDGKVGWRCGQRACRKRITVTAARELGLLPAKTRP